MEVAAARWFGGGKAPMASPADVEAAFVALRERMGRTVARMMARARVEDAEASSA